MTNIFKVCFRTFGLVRSGTELKELSIIREQSGPISRQDRGNQSVMDIDGLPEPAKQLVILNLGTSDWRSLREVGLVEHRDTDMLWQALHI